MNEALSVVSERPLSVPDVLNQVALIQDLMSQAMKDGEHFGKIPGCGDKPSLLQPGAQKLLLLFRMCPDYIVEVIDLSGGHREYRVQCRLSSASGTFVGAGVGSCSTMESKWRYRTGPKKSTGQPVPKDYWDRRKSDPVGAQQSIGGKGFSTMKDENGQWVICEQGERVEHDNPADYYNTCLKMGKKRALVDATLTRTAASDIFTQDIEEIAENLKAAQGEPVAESASAKPAPEPKSIPQPAQRTARKRSEPVHLGNVTTCEAMLKDFREQSGTSQRGPWTARFCTFETPDGGILEAGTFDKKLFEATEVLKGQECVLTYRPGSKAGTFELLTLEPADLVPMS